MFRPNLVPATPENREALKKWLAPLNSTPSVVGKIDNLPGRYDPREYEASELTRLYYWVRPIQAAMEQKADNIFVLCSGYGHQIPPEEEIMRRQGIESKDEWMLGRGWGPERVAIYDRERQQWRDKARQKLAKENAARKAAGQPPKFIADSHWWYYMTTELNWDIPDDKPQFWKEYARFGYKPEELIDHFDAIYTFNYVPQKLPKPAIHIVKLIASDGSSIDPPGGDGPTFQYNSLKKIPKEFKGRFEHLQGAETVEALLKNNDLDE